MKHILYAWLVLMLMSACAGMPQLDTMNKRVAAMEISYLEVLATIKLNEGSLTSSQKLKIAQTLIDFNKSRDLMYLALKANDSGGFDNSIVTINTLLRGLRTLLSEPNGRLDYGISKHANITGYGDYRTDSSIEDTGSRVSCSIGEPGRDQRGGSIFASGSGHQESGFDRLFARQTAYG